MPGIVKIIFNDTSMCNTRKIENLLGPLPASYPCMFNKENNTVVTTIFRNLGAKLVMKYLTEWIGQLS